tara:strand:- start:68 stop:346 length:279 start_codon:yes stop_codon:yes gene_type:complete
MYNHKKNTNYERMYWSEVTKKKRMEEEYERKVTELERRLVCFNHLKSENKRLNERLNLYKGQELNNLSTVEEIQELKQKIKNYEINFKNFFY